MADETVEIPVNVPGADEAANKFTRLQTKIRETRTALQEAEAAGDKVTFKKLKKDLDDLEDGLEKTNLKSKQFDDALAGLPGPAGQAGQAMKGLDGAFKLFLANPIVAVIGGLAGLFMALKASLESTAEGQAVLNRVSQGFSKILGPILATLEAVAIPVFEAFADAIEFVASGFNKFARFLGISESKIKESTLSVDKVQQEANKKEADRQKEAQDARDKAEKERQERAKRAAEERRKQQEEEAKKEKERRLKIIEDQDQAEKELRYRLEASKTERAKIAIGVRDADEQAAATRKLERDQMLANALANVQAFTTKKTEENTQKQIEIEEKAFQARQALLYGISAAITAASDLVGRNTVAGKALAVSATLINTYASIAGQLRAFAGVPIPGYAIAQAIATGLVGLKAVRDIIAVKVPTTSGGGAGSAGGAGSIGGGAQAPTPAFSNTTIGAPQVGAAAGQTGTLANIVAGSINQNQSQVQPIRAYVIGNEVTTQQQLDRRISTAARLGG